MKIHIKSEVGMKNHRKFIAACEWRRATGNSVCQAHLKKASASPHRTFEGERQIIQAPFAFQKNLVIAFLARVCHSLCTWKEARKVKRN